MVRELEKILKCTLAFIIRKYYNCIKSNIFSFIKSILHFVHLIISIFFIYLILKIKYVVIHFVQKHGSQFDLKKSFEHTFPHISQSIILSSISFNLIHYLIKNIFKKTNF